MLIKDIEYLEVADSSEQVNGGYELVVAASTTNISGVYRGNGYVSGSIYGYSGANLGYRSYYYPYEREPEAYANSGANFSAR